MLSVCLTLPALATAEPAQGADWRNGLRTEIERLDHATPGELGVYVKTLQDGQVFSHGADQVWYLGSTAKVPIAIAVLQQVDAGRLKLTDTLVLRDTDKVDGSGPLVWNQPGTSYSIDVLLRRMLGDSDNTAANLLVRGVGEDSLNRSAAALLGNDRNFAGLTTFTQVRRDVYAQLHPQARTLSNRQLVEVAAVPVGPQRVKAVQRALDVPASALTTDSMAEAYARYYRTRRNSTTLSAYGGMLEQLVRGQLLSPQATERLFKAMKFENRGNYRLEGGLPPRVRFIHKTGTQFERACHMGVVEPQDGGARAVVVAVCAAHLDEKDAAGRLFQQVGRAVSRAVLGG